jgi:hypothetical protein
MRYLFLILVLVWTSAFAANREIKKDNATAATFQLELISPTGACAIPVKNEPSECAPPVDPKNDPSRKTKSE